MSKRELIGDDDGKKFLKEGVKGEEGNLVRVFFFSLPEPRRYIS